MNPRRVRPGLLLVISAGAALALAGCSTGGTDSPAVASAAPTELSGTVSLWHFFSDREAGVVQNAVDQFEKANPNVKVVVHSGQDDAKLQQVISSGGDVDVAVSYSSDIVGNFCSTGAFVDLEPYLTRDKVDLEQFPKVVRTYTEYDGTRCTLPLLADVPALYMNSAALAAAGITTPPTTLDELEADGLKMTTYNDDGSIKTLGFNPLMGFYENTPMNFGPTVDAQWLDADGQAAVADSTWPEVMQWQKKFVDAIG